MQNKINKKYQFFFLFHFRILNIILKRKKKDNMAQDIVTVKNEKKNRKEKEGRKKKEKGKKEID